MSLQHAYQDWVFGEVGLCSGETQYHLLPTLEVEPCHYPTDACLCDPELRHLALDGFSGMVYVHRTRIQRIQVPDHLPDID